MSRPKPSSAANGRLSHGPTTQAGKDRSRFNALVHGLTAQRAVLLKNESPEKFQKLVVAFNCTFRPDNVAEDSAVSSMIANEWRLRRAQSIETSMMNDALDDADPDRNPAEVLCALIDTKGFTALTRYQATLQNNFNRSARTLAFLRKNFPHTATSMRERDVKLNAVARSAGQPLPADPPPPPPPAESAPEPMKQAPPQPAPEQPAPAFASFAERMSPSPQRNQRPEPHFDPGRWKSAA